MVFKKWYNAQMERHEAAKAERADPDLATRRAEEKADRAAAKRSRPPIGAYGVHSFRDNLYRYLPAGQFKNVTKDIAGAVADFESGASNQKTTAGRVIAGAVIAGPAGAIVGGMFKKDKSRCYVTVTFADGDVAIIDGPTKDETRLRNFAQQINAASRYAATI